MNLEKMRLKRESKIHRARSDIFKTKGRRLGTR